MEGFLFPGIARQVHDAEFLRDRHRRHIGTRGCSHRGQFGDGFHFDPHGHEKPPHLSRRGVSFDERLHRALRFVPGKILRSPWPFGDFDDKFLHRYHESLCKPHSVLVKFFHRPARGSSPGITGLVQ